MPTVKQLLNDKGGDVWFVSPDDSVFSAIQEMARRDIGALVVVDEGKPVGMFTERDYARDVVLKGKSSPTTPIRDVMTSHVIYVGPDQTIEECMAVMTDKHVRHLPILHEDKLVGMVSIGDLVKSIIADQKFTIEQLENYIRGR